MAAEKKKQARPAFALEKELINEEIDGEIRRNVEKQGDEASKR
jgi:hypothetical protein